MTARLKPDAIFQYIQSCASHRALLLCRALHARLIVIGLTPLTRFKSKLMSVHVGLGELSVARKMFDEMPSSNYHRWIVLIGAYAKARFYNHALDLLGEMREVGIKPNNYVLPSVLKCCGHLSDSQTGKKLHALSIRCQFDYDVFVISALIDMYSRCGLIEKARYVFNSMSVKDLVAVNALVSGYVHQGMVKEALRLVEKVKSLGVSPNVVTWNTLISGFSRAGDDLMVDELFQVMRDTGVEPDVVSWTSIISGFVQNFQNKEAFLTFRKMLGFGCLPSSNTISTLLSACANTTNSQRGKEIHGYAIVIGVEEDLYVRSALVDMYAKCGFISQASTLFKTTSKKNSVTWNSMIFGYANHGYSLKAIELFETMQHENREEINHLTFTAVLTACTHGGMLELGRNLFRVLQKQYRIMPRLEHYALMVDLLGRAGKLTEAYEMIRGMPIEPDLFVWGALLGACRKHGEMDLAREAANRLRELEPESGGSSVLMSSLYAGKGSWGDVERLKKVLKKRKLKNISGCSWIETG